MSLFTVLKYGNIDLTSLKELSDLPPGIVGDYFSKIYDKTQTGTGRQIFHKILLEYEEEE